MEHKILVIDDEKNILESMKMVLAYENYEVNTAIDGIDGIDLFKRWQPDVVLLDVKIPGTDGLQILKALKEIRPFSEVVMISGHSGIEEAIEAAKYGAFDFLEKPVSRDKLLLTVRNALDKINLLKENYTLKSQSDRKYVLVGESAAMQQLKDIIKRVAKSDSTVLISGESGTGKELIARSIHRESSREKNRFVQVNCAAIPDELIESELFGHEKGSFTGAIDKKIGKFEYANMGSIFLDEIGDLSLKAQAKVLRVLEEGELQAVGSSEIKHVNVRVIAATNKNLEEEIKNNRFREDLFFRLNVVPLHSPALRERRSDIPLLISHFIRYFSEENNYRQKNFGAEALQILTNWDWQGNVRELRNVIERLLIMTIADKITPGDLPAYIRPMPAEPAFTIEQIKTWKEFKAFSEKTFLQQKLQEFNFNIARTAREIDLPRSNLYSKLESLGIEFPNNADE